MEQPDNTRDIHIKIMKSLYYLTLFTQWRERLTPDASPGPGFRPGRSARESPSASGVETTREGPAGQRQRLKTTGVETARVRRSGEASSWPSPGARKRCAWACRRNPRGYSADRSAGGNLPVVQLAEGRTLGGLVSGGASGGDRSRKGPAPKRAVSRGISQERLSGRRSEGPEIMRTKCGAPKSSDQIALRIGFRPAAEARVASPAPGENCGSLSSRCRAEPPRRSGPGW